MGRTEVLLFPCGLKDDLKDAALVSQEKLFASMSRVKQPLSKQIVALWLSQASDVVLSQGIHSHEPEEPHQVEAKAFTRHDFESGNDFVVKEQRSCHQLIQVFIIQQSCRWRHIQLEAVQTVLYHLCLLRCSLDETPGQFEVIVVSFLAFVSWAAEAVLNRGEATVASPSLDCCHPVPQTVGENWHPMRTVKRCETRVDLLVRYVQPSAHGSVASVNEVFGPLAARNCISPVLSFHPGEFQLQPRMYVEVVGSPDLACCQERSVVSRQDAPHFA